MGDKVDGQRIRIGIEPHALGTMNRLLRGDGDRIVHEVAQNARRAQARTLRVTVTDEMLVMEDDGLGIRDPAVLLACGRSGWTRAPAYEWPEGTGLFALGLQGAEIASRPAAEAGGEHPGWVVYLSPAAFTGDEQATVRESESAPTPHGTRVSVPDGEGRWSADRIRTLLRHYRLGITVNGEPLRYRPFTREGSGIHVTMWQGLAISIEEEPSSGGAERAEVNFHGRTVHDESIRSVRTEDSEWRVRIDVRECGRLHLRAPDRTAIVRDRFHDMLRDKVEECAYRAMGASGRDIRLDHRQWKRARKRGVDLDAPKPYGRRWTPRTADPYRFTIEAAKALAGKATRMPAGLSAIDEQVVARALRLNPEAARELTPIETMEEAEGFEWYDRLDEVWKIVAVVTTAGETETIHLLQADGTKRKHERTDNRTVDSVTVKLTVWNPATRTEREVTLPTDVVFRNNEENSLPDTVGMRLRKNTAGTNLAEIRNLTLDGFLRTTDESEDGSYEEQRERYERETAEAVTRIVRGEDAATRETIDEMVRRHIAWRVPRGTTATIAIDAEGRATTRLERAS